MASAPKPAGPGRRAATYRIREPRQIKALASPARQEIVDSLALSGPVPVAELAADLGRAADSLYYHLRMLENVGLIVRRGTRGEGSSQEVLYDVPGARMLIDQEPGTPHERSTLMSVVSAALRSAERELRAALDSGRAVYRRTRRRNAWGARAKGWLDADQLAEVRGHLEAISEIVLGGRKRPGATLQSITYVLAPLEPSKRAMDSRPTSNRKKP